MKHAAQHNTSSKKQDYDWLEDPFNEEKQKEDLEMMKSSGGTKLALGCLIAIIVIIVIAVVGSIGISSMFF